MATSGPMSTATAAPDGGNQRRKCYLSSRRPQHAGQLQRFVTPRLRPVVGPSGGLSGKQLQPDGTPTTFQRAPRLPEQCRPKRLGGHFYCQPPGPSDSNQRPLLEHYASQLGHLKRDLHLPAKVLPLGPVVRIDDVSLAASDRRGITCYWGVVTRLRRAAGPAGSCLPKTQKTVTRKPRCKSRRPLLSTGVTTFAAPCSRTYTGGSWPPGS